MTTPSIGNEIGNKLIAIIEKVKADLLSKDFATQEYVQQVISAGLIYRVCEELPNIQDAEPGVVYLVPVGALAKDKNNYKEYVCVNGEWEDIGSTELNLEDYPNKATIQGYLDTKMDKNDSSIPTKLSDLTRDSNSLFVSLEVRNELPAIELAEYNTIYLVPNVSYSVYDESRTWIVKPSDCLGTIMDITNNKNSEVYIYHTPIGGYEDSTPVLQITGNGEGTYTIPSNTQQLRVRSLSGTLDISVKWSRDTECTYVKYIKVNSNNEDKWEVLGNPNNATFAYINEHYYKKSEIYTSTDIEDAVDNLKNMLDAETTAYN